MSISADNVGLRERLAALEHQQWIYWNKGLPKEYRKPDLWVPYEQLAEDVKELDRKFAKLVVKQLVELAIIPKKLPKDRTYADRLASAVSKLRDGLGDLEGVRDDVESWKSNLEGTNLENSEKYQSLEEAHSTLEEQCEAIGSALDDVEAVDL